VGGQAGLDAQLAGEDAVALGVGVAQAVPVFVGDLLVGLAHGRDDLADEFVLVREGLFEVGAVADVRGHGECLRTGWGVSCR